MTPDPRPKRRDVPFLIVLVVGPGEQLGALEVLDSARAYCRGPYRAIVVDDTGDLTTWAALRRYPEVDLLRNWRRRGFRYLLNSLQRAYRRAERCYDAEALLKLDTDALITGPGLDADILRFVREHPAAGLVGSRSWPERNDALWKEKLEANLETWGPLMAQAERHGYQRGEAVLGGAYVMTRQCLRALGAGGYLARTPTGPRIAEDVTFSLFSRALGFELVELAGPQQPLALAWRGLTMPPQEIMARGKKAIHSVKFLPPDLRVRGFFAKQRRRTLSLRAIDGEQVEASLALARRTASLRAWMRWRPSGARALTDARIPRARHIFTRCRRLSPWRPAVWLYLAVSMFPRWVVRTVRIVCLPGLRLRRRLLYSRLER
jgi:hypothetical protein